MVALLDTLLVCLLQLDLCLEGFWVEMRVEA